MGTRKFSELRAEIAADPIRAERLRKATEEVVATTETYSANLKQLRQARGLTQVQLAHILGTSQPEISRIERQTDVYLSTLQSYVTAMGGQLKLMVSFDDEPSSPVDFADFTPAREPSGQLPVLSVQADARKGDDEPADLPERLVTNALEQGPSRQALREIGNFLRARGLPNSASLVAAIMAETIAAGGDKTTAARELGAAGALARQAHKSKLAELFWRKSLDYDPTNYRSRSHLGQLLHHQGRYAEAIESLETVASMDNHAALFLGWSLLRRGIDTNDDEARTKGINEITSSMHRWAYAAGTSQRASWLRQARRLYDLGGQFRGDVEHLLAFASSNSNFGEVTLDDLLEVDPAFGSPANSDDEPEFGQADDAELGARRA